MSERITGSATIHVDGKDYKTEDGVTINPGGANRPEKTGGGKVLGYQEETVAPSLEIPIVHNKNVSLRELSDITGATVFVETDTGAQYIYRDAWTSEPATLGVKDGSVPLKMTAIACEEVG